MLIFSFNQIWDLATGSLIDVMRCALVCLGASFSEGGEYLATCHEKQRAVYIWANKNIFVSNLFINPNIAQISVFFLFF